MAVEMILSIGFLLAAPVTGFALLKSYEDFCRGVEKKNRLLMWSALSVSSFLFMILIPSIARVVIKSPAKSISGHLYVMAVDLFLSLIAGYGLLKSYDIFKKGVSIKNRFFVWTAFLIGSAIFMLIWFVAIKLVFS